MDDNILLSVKIEFSQDGTAAAEWWTPEVGEVMCAMCGLEGTKQCKENLMCLNKNPYCG